MVSLIAFKALYFILFFIAHLLGSIIGSRIKSKCYSFLIDLFCGCFLLSVSLNHIYHISASDIIFKTYPYQSLISIIIFSFLTLLYFIRDSTSIIDESMLVKYDTTGSSVRDNHQYTLNSTEIQQIFQNDLISHNNAKENNVDTQFHKPKFRFLDQFPLLLYYIISLESVISFGIYLSTYNKSQLNHNCPYFLGFRLIESIILSILLSRVPISKIIFWIMIITFSIFSFFILIANESSSTKTISMINHIYRFSFSFLLGIYFYFGSLLLHNGFSNSSNSLFFSLLVIILSFISPYLLSIGIDYNI